MPQTTPYSKRLIEVDLPIKRISAHARREKSIRHGHISTLHIWWARRPLAACRAVICAALWPDPAHKLCPQVFIDTAKNLILSWAKNHLQKASADSLKCLTTINKNPEFLEIFSRYSSVEKASGELVTLKEYLEYVWAAVSREALSMIFSDADATGFEEDARLTAMWLWTLSTGAVNGESGVEAAEEESDDDDEESSGKSSKVSGYVLEFDAARKIAQGLGAPERKP